LKGATHRVETSLRSHGHKVRTKKTKHPKGKVVRGKKPHDPPINGRSENPQNGSIATNVLISIRNKGGRNRENFLAKGKGTKEALKKKGGC